MSRQRADADMRGETGMAVTQKEIDRINQLSRKAKTEGLSPEEKEEQAKLRRRYIDSVKAALVQQLENTYIMDEKGNKSKLHRKHTPYLQ